MSGPSDWYDPFGLKEPPVKIVISGHSSNPNEYDDDNNYFDVPGNYHIHFYANKNETCFVPYDEGDLKMVVNSMNSTTHDIFGPYQRVDNYNIEFDGKPGTGIFEYDGKAFELLSGENMTLEDIIDFLDEKYNNRQIELYAVFCRGSDREKFGDFQSVLSSSNFSDFSDLSDFDSDSGYDSNMSLDSGVKKNRSKTKRKMLKPKKKMRKTKQKKTIKSKKKKTIKSKKKKTIKSKKKKKI
jgi:hypothetical protein